MKSQIVLLQEPTNEKYLISHGKILYFAAHMCALTCSTNLGDIEPVLRSKWTQHKSKQKTDWMTSGCIHCTGQRGNISGLISVLGPVWNYIPAQHEATLE